jgi:hypothetical protein
MSIDGSRILTVLNLQNLATRIGVKGIVTAVLDPVVRPVAIVDGSVQAISGQTLDIPSTAGETTAPGANTRLATTPPLPAGQFNLTFAVSSGTDGRDFRLRRRNAADSADIWAIRWVNAQTGSTPVGKTDEMHFNTMRVLVAASEFFVIENVGAGSAGVVYQASIWVQGPF